MLKLFKNIGCIWGITEVSEHIKKGSEMNSIRKLENAWLLVENGLILDFGNDIFEVDRAEIVDLRNKEILPGFVDSHTHTVFAAGRETEFEMRLKGATYEEIAAAGGGILNSAQLLQATSQETLLKLATERVTEMIQHGTTCLEIKSGYGLSVESELKILRVIKQLKSQFSIPIFSTFLGAHAIPAQFKTNRQEYIDLIVNQMLPAIERENLADFIDVFCDKGFFTPAETEYLLQKGKAANLQGKIHGNELGLTGGVQVAVKNNCYSVDHLEHCTNEEFELLFNSATVPVVLPGSSYFLDIPYAPARAMIDFGLGLAVASDFNPGSSPCFNMQQICSLACNRYKISTTEAFWAATLNAANALRIQTKLGSIEKGKLANFWVSKHKNALHAMSYYFGSNQAEQVFVAGEPF